MLLTVDPPSRAVTLRQDVVPARRALGRRPGLPLVGVTIPALGPLAAFVATAGARCSLPTSPASSLRS